MVLTNVETSGVNRVGYEVEGIQDYILIMKAKVTLVKLENSFEILCPLVTVAKEGFPCPEVDAISW